MQMTPKKSNPMQLKDFRGVNPNHIACLQRIGIKTAPQLLSRGSTPSSRAALADTSGVPLDAVLELVKLSDLSRLPGVKGIRARLYYDAGVNCVEKLASFNQSELLALTADFVSRTGFDGIPPLPKEVSSTITNARNLPRLVEW
jgi:hypothetical protein